MNNNASRPASCRFAIDITHNALFLICAVALMATALGLRPATSWLAQRYKKESVPLRRSLRQLDTNRFSSFTLDKTSLFDMPDAQAIGTSEFFNAAFIDRSPGAKPESIRLFVTYYSTPGDKVPHTPDVCARQVGIVVRRESTVTFDAPEVSPTSPLKAIRLDLERPDAQAVMLYLFYANGQFCQDREQARWIINLPGKRYIYFSKVEVIAEFEKGADPEPYVRQCERLLREALPVLINEYYPADNGGQDTHEK